jgi:hypothetical protein
MSCSKDFKIVEKKKTCNANGRRLYQYSPRKISLAVRAVRGQGLSVAKAAETFGVPRTTLRDKLEAGTSNVSYVFINLLIQKRLS